VHVEHPHRLLLHGVGRREDEGEEQEAEAEPTLDEELAAAAAETLPSTRAPESARVIEEAAAAEEPDGP